MRSKMAEGALHSSHRVASMVVGSDWIGDWMRDHEEIGAGGPWSDTVLVVSYARRIKVGAALVGHSAITAARDDEFNNKKVFDI